MAAKLTLQQYGETHDVEVVCCDTRPSENEDNYRFSKQCEEWLGKPITYIRNPKYATIDEVFEKTRYMAGQNGARCTTELKKNPRHEYAKPDDIHVFGFTADEPKRIREFESRNPELKLLWILQKNSIRKKDCYTMIAGAGIRLPEMYLMGFTNNNCPGCVKASSPWYWSMVRKFYPEVFRRRAEQSRAEPSVADWSRLNTMSESFWMNFQSGNSRSPDGWRICLADLNVVALLNRLDH